MFPLAGYILLNKPVASSEKDGHFFNELFSKFPSGFHTKNILSNDPLFLAGNIGSFCGFESGHHLLFFSGEIFNYKEIAGSMPSFSNNFQNNAGLILALIEEKGIQAIEKINGQFIIIHLDTREKKVHIINDHFGISQLYYYHDKNIFLFGSELKFLLTHPACPKEIDWETSLKRPEPSGISCYKSYKTWFKEINLLPGASVLNIDLESGQIQINNYWKESFDPNYDHSHDKRTTADVMEEYISLLNDAVKIRTGGEEICHSLLSGGLDSSAIVALAAKYKPVETFSIVTQMTWLEETTLACNKLKTNLGIKNAQFLVPVHKLSFDCQLWKQRIWRAESPVNHNDSLTKTLLHFAIKKKNPEVTALLTGTGSDEFNGGYARWQVTGAEVEDNWEQFHNTIIDAEDYKLKLHRGTALWSRKNLINREFLASISGNKIEQNPWMIYVDSSLHSLTYSLLWDEVRASSYHGHTTLFPFLDFRFLPFISKIPPALHKDLFFDKTILRTPLKKILPDYIINKSKVPAYVPEYDYRAKLFKFLTEKDSMKMVEESLEDINRQHPVINKPELMKRIAKMQQEPDIAEWHDIMHIINLGLLEKLPYKTEKDMDMESSIGEMQELIFDDVAKTKIFLADTFSYKKEKIDLQKPLLFSEGAFLLFNTMNNKYFLAKNNELKFEIEDENTDWINFLNKIDNRLSIEQITGELKIEYAAIQEFVNIALEEKILST
ncbi:MAG: asparagine synthase-related protein [Ginsengibacter sp.]